MRSKIKSILKWTLITLVTIFLGGVLAIFIFKDRIVEQVLVEVNKSLQVPIDVSKVDIDFFHGFPNISVAFYDVILPAGSPESIIDAKKLYALLDPIAIAQGVINVDHLEIIDAQVNIYVNKDNKINIVELFKNNDQVNKDSSAEGGLAPGFSLNSVLLKNVKLNYRNDYTGSTNKWLVNRVIGNINLTDQLYSTKIDGVLIAKEVSTRKWSIDRERELNINLDLTYDLTDNTLDISNSVINMEGASLRLSGNLAFLKIPMIDVVVNAEDISFKLIGSALPEVYKKKLNEYKSTGKVNFEATLKGQFLPQSLPRLDSKITISEVNLYDKRFNANIEDLNLMAKLTFDDISSLETGNLVITSATGLLQKSPFEFDLSLANFMRPEYSLKFSGAISTSWLLADLEYPYYESGKGEIAIDIRANEKLGKDAELISSTISGSLELKDISFKWSDSISVDKIDGVIRFSDDNLSLNNLKLKWLQSDIMVNGTIQDIRHAGEAIAENLLLKSEIKSNMLAVEDIAALIRNIPIKPDTTQTSSKIGIDLELLCQFDELKFKRYRGTNISGEVTLQDNLMEITDLLSKGMGGAMKINGLMKLMPNKDIYINANVVTKGVHLDSLFYVFNNFQQGFIVDTELNGQLYADVDASMYFDSTWRFRRPLLTSRAKLRIVDGELNNFAPIMALSNFLDDKDDNLASLRFSDLVNHVTIKEDTVFIPEMVVRTNVRNIAAGGYHTLNQHINYQLAVPIINERVDKDEAFGAVQKSSKGSPNLLFRIKGTTTDYKVNYDLLRATGNVLKLLDITKIFKKKTVEPVDSTFLDDEEFDWEN